MDGNTLSSLEAERAFFRDYFGVGSQPGFSCNLRSVAADALLAAYASETDENRKRLIYLNVHQQLCLTFEDVGAVLYAIEQKVSAGRDFLESYLAYVPGEAYIAKVIAGKSDRQIQETFGFGGELQALYTQHGIPRQKLWKDREHFVKHVRSIAKIQEDRKTICNKLKHGGVVLSAGGEVLRGRGDPEYMSALSYSYDKGTNTRIWHTDSLKYGELELRTFARVVNGATMLLKTLAFQYVIRFHDDLRDEWLREMAT